MKIQFDIPPSSAQETNGLSVRYAASKRQVPRWRWYLLLTMVLAPPAYLLTRFSVSYWWETAPALIVAEQVVVRTHEAGRVARIASVGDQVSAGKPLMELQRPALMDGRTPSEPALAQEPNEGVSRAQTQALVLRQSTLDEAHRLAKSQLDLLKERLHTMESLRAQGAATRQEVDNAQLQELQALAETSKAHATASENKALLARERATTPAPLQSASPQNGATPSAKSGVMAPFDVMVVRQLVRQGEWVEPGTDVAVLQGQADPLVHTYLPPEEARYAQVGRQATLRFMDGGRARAEVVDVVAETERTPSDRASPLSPRMPSIVVRLRPLAPLPAAYRIHQLPLDVRFDWVWSWR